MNSNMFETAKKAEIKELQRHKTWPVEPKRDIPEGANTLRGRFVLNLKKVGSVDEKAKACYVVQGNCDKEKREMVHNVTSLRQSSTRLIISVASVK